MLRRRFTPFSVVEEKGISLLVFFFKQKTAYEMRISDWSSDVCSSDLNSFSQDSFFRMRMSPFTCRRQRVYCFIRICSRNQALICGTGTLAKLGRASCRERVCQYV